MFCPFCGTYYEKSTPTCVVCGKPLNGAAGMPPRRKPNTARTPENSVPTAQEQGFSTPQQTRAPVPYFPRGNNDTERSRGSAAPAGTRPAEEDNKTAEPEKKSPLVPVLISVLVLLALIGAWLVIISSGNFGDGWFTRP